MSWIFGNLSGTKGNQVSTNLDLNNSHDIASGGSSDHKVKNQQNVTKNQQMQVASGYAFDSTSLERAAKAARELERSPLASQIIEMTKQQYEIKKEEYRAKVKEYEAAVEHAKIEQKRIDFDLNTSYGIASDGSLAQQKKNNQDTLRSKERVEVDKLERDNYQTYLKDISLGFFYGTTLVLAYHTAKFSIPMIGRSIRSRIFKPQLVRETSRLNINDLWSNPIAVLKRTIRRKEDELFKDVVFNSPSEVKLRNLSNSIKNIKRNKDTFPNVHFYGPPGSIFGTGKTLAAKKLITSTNMEYATVNGRSLSTLEGPERVTAIHKLFDWASTSRRGVILFIDEAEAFLRRHNSLSISENISLNAFLDRTGTPSSNFMLILASNLPNEFDEAVRNRINKKIKFDLPGLTERERLVRLYFEKFILEPFSQKKSRSKVANFDYDKACSKVAEMTDGFSAGDIRYLGREWQSAIYISSEGILTEDLMMKVVEETKRENDESRLNDIQLEKEKLMKSKLLKID